MLSRLSSSAVSWALLVALLAACNSQPSTTQDKPPTTTVPDDGIDRLPGVPGDGADEFISDIAGNGATGGRAGATSPAASGAAESADNAQMAPSGAPVDDGATRAIAEADILQVQGDLLFALSAYAGLTI